MVRAMKRFTKHILWVFACVWWGIQNVQDVLGVATMPADWTTFQEQFAALSEAIDFAVIDWILLFIMVSGVIAYATPRISCLQRLTDRAKTFWYRYAKQDDIASQGAEERRRQLRSRLETFPENGRIVAKLILESNLPDAKTIYDDFLKDIADDIKQHKFAPAYAWACVLVKHGKFEEGGDLRQETNFEASFESAEQANDDEQEFFVKPGGQKALDDWIAEQQ